MADDSDILEDDVFEESADERQFRPAAKNQTYNNKPWDEAYEVSQDLSMAESFDAREKQNIEKERKLKNDKYDEAVEVSQSIDQGAINAAMGKMQNQIRNTLGDKDSSAKDAKDSKMPSNNNTSNDSNFLNKNSEMTKSQSILNKPFDEAFEVSQSESEDGMDALQKYQQQNRQSQQSQQPQQLPPQQVSKQNIQLQPQQQPPQRQQHQAKANDDGESSEEEEHEESYEQIEGAYNPKDYQNLNVPAEVRDLFQYIERYKPQEVELDTPLKCFIPEFIPAIGELDAFLKVPRPDAKEDGCGLKYLDEPASNQSDPTVLELQLRAKSKKLQYGDVAVRSIEYADKNPAKIDRWIQDISELHRSKPPPQVNYRKNMPDMDKLMDIWPDEFEQLLAHTALPSPDLDLSLLEYVKVLCAILDIPVYENNPVESLHLLFSLFIEFKNNPHFQERLDLGIVADGKGIGANKRAEDKFGGADVLQIEDDYN